MEHWQKIFQNNIRSYDELRELIPLPNTLSPFPKFPLNIPRRLVEKMEPGDFNDPLFLQFVPLASELIATPGFVNDPVSDEAAARTTKLLHKYKGRALLLVSSACAMHCRYCFRQKYPYEKDVKEYEKELAIIEADPSITEVILSGGDPLSKGNSALGLLLEALDAIPHVKVIRFHSRFPIGIPERISDEFISLLKGISTQIVFILHVNHARELDADVVQSMKKLMALGIPVLSQSVLLRGINDSLPRLKELVLSLIHAGIVPYYLHQLDRVQNTAHFEVDPEDGIALIEQLRKEVPGYAVPTYVQEIGGEASKTPLHSVECLQA